MAYTNKMVSCREVLAKIQRTFKPQGSSWIQEAIEDIGWAIQGIGYHMGFEKGSTPFPYITVANHRGKKPCYVERVLAVELLLPTESRTNILNPDGTTPAPTEADLKCGKFSSIRLKLGSDISNPGLEDENSPRTTRALPNAPYYTESSDYIITSFSNGLIKLHGVFFCLDKDGFPRVVDDFDYKSALEWYLFSQMLLKGYKHQEVSYKDAFANWEMYRLRAENAGKLMSLDGADKFKASWSRYIQNNEVAKDFFINNEQTVYISE